MIYNEARVEMLKQRYPEGTRICLEFMDDLCPVPSGTCGTVDFIDDAGTLHCTFDDGRTLGVIYGTDIFHVIPKGKITAENKYPVLVGRSSDGNKRLHNPKETAEFISDHGKSGDVKITTEANILILKTKGEKIAEIYDEEFCSEVQKELDILNEPTEELEETEEQNMSM